MKRTCKNCGKTQDLTAFPKDRVRDGKTYYRHVCRVCYNKRKSIWRRARKDWWVEFKKTQQCTRCGNDDHRILEFHHIGKKEFGLAYAVNEEFARARILAEVKKCICLCANCHRIRHYGKK